MLLKGLTRLAASVASPGAAGARLTVLMYHRVLQQPDPIRPYDITAATFAGQMQAAAGVFNILRLDEAMDKLAHGRLPARSMCVTFDDGYRDNAEVAVPILQRLGLNATFFVTSGMLGNGRMFNDTVIEAVRRLPAGPQALGWLDLGNPVLSDTASRLRLITLLIAKLKHMAPDLRDAACERLAASVDTSLPTDLMMTREQVTALDRAGQIIGGHTVTHATLTTLSAEESRRQIETNRDDLASLMRSAPAYFAYPNGRPLQDYTDEHAQQVREAGYQAAFSTAWGQITNDDDRFHLRRSGSFDVAPIRFVTRLLRHGRHAPPPFRSRRRAAPAGC